MSDTPRTDEEILSIECEDSCCGIYVKTNGGRDVDGDVVSADFARTLEREIARLRGEVEKAWKEFVKITPYMSPELEAHRWNNSRARRVAEGKE